MDIARLGLEVRSDGVVVATKRLRQLEQQSGRADGAVARMARAVKGALAGVAIAAAAAFGGQARYDEGPEVVYGIEQEQHAVASYYRNTIIHFFVNKAIIELAMVKTSEFEGNAALEVFWSEVDKLRDLFKFEFFYAPTELFHQQIREELGRYSGDWEQLLQQGQSGFLRLQGNMLLLAAHVTLLTYAEAYSVVADLLARLDEWESLSEADCVAQALKLGHQAYLQRRISSPASIGKLLFKNGFRMAQHRQLTEGGGKEVARGRKALSMEIRDVLQRLELIRAIGVAARASSVEAEA